jgi:hypothetical protein
MITLIEDSIYFGLFGCCVVVPRFLHITITITRSSYKIPEAATKTKTSYLIKNNNYEVATNY